MGRAPCCDKGNVNKGPWSPEEDRKLKEYIHSYGTGGNWIALPAKAGLRRCGKSCRLRWLNYLRPNIRHGGFSDEEDSLICGLFATIGSRRSVIAVQLPGRTDNDVKNHWNTKLKKKLHLLVAAAARGRPTTPRPYSSTRHQHLCIPVASPLSPEHHHHGTSSGPVMSGSSSLCSVDSCGLYCFFDISNNNNTSSAVGLESFVFGGLHFQQQQEEFTQGNHHLFPAAAESETHQRQYHGGISYGHVTPSGCTGSSFFFYGGDGHVATTGGAGATTQDQGILVTLKKSSCISFFFCETLYMRRPRIYVYTLTPIKHAHPTPMNTFERLSLKIDLTSLEIDEVTTDSSLSTKTSSPTEK